MAIKVNNSMGIPEISIYGDIADNAWDDTDVTAKSFSDKLKALGDIQELNVRINSYGGSVFAGQAIHSMLRSHKAKVTIVIDGVAASIASVIAMAGDKVVMPSNAMLMIHNPWSWTVGNSEDMRKTADDLDKIRESLISAYQHKSPLSRDEIIAIMDEETWLTADEALEKGFIDEISDAMPIAASISDGFASFNGVKIGTNKISAKGLKAISTVAEGKTPVISNKEEKGMDLETLKAQHPELFASFREEAYNAGVEAERARIKAIEDMAVKGHDNLVADAKFKTGASAEALAFAVINAEKQQRASYLSSVSEDAEGLEGVASTGDAPLQGNEEQAEKDEGTIAKVKTAFNSAVASIRR